MNTLRAPITCEEFTQYYQLRWHILRKPWQQPLGSEQDDQEEYAIHRMIIDDNNNTLAVGRLEKSSNQQGQIRFMAVDPKAQGQGLGKQIVEALEIQASILGISQLYLNARKSALGFYQSLGYENIGYSHTLYEEIEHFRMVKALAKPSQHKLEQAQALQKIWHNTIPLSKAMDLQISFFDGVKLITHCDEAFNQNLHHTMFAGSIYTLATLTGWGWVYLALKEQQEAHSNLQGDIVLAQADIRYHSPIKGLAYGQLTQDNVKGTFDNLLIGKKAKISVKAHVYCGDKIAATFQGSYVVIPKK